MKLVTAVTKAVAWTTKSKSGRAKALGQLAIDLATEMGRPAKKDIPPPPIAALAKELRATLTEIEGLSDGDETQASLAAVLSAPVWDSEKPKPAKPRTTRSKGGGSTRKAADAVAKTGGGRSRRTPA